MYTHTVLKYMYVKVCFLNCSKQQIFFEKNKKNKKKQKTKNKKVIII